MNCREFTEFLHLYLFDALPPEERAEFEKHLAECPWCTDYMDSYRKTIFLAHGAYHANGNGSSHAGPPDDLVRAILQARGRAP